MDKLKSPRSDSTMTDANSGLRASRINPKRWDKKNFFEIRYYQPMGAIPIYPKRPSAG
jgi:hypothetical protein